MYLVYLSFCKICNWLSGYKNTDLASLNEPLTFTTSSWRRPVVLVAVGRMFQGLWRRLPHTSPLVLQPPAAMWRYDVRWAAHWLRTVQCRPLMWVNNSCVSFWIQTCWTFRWKLCFGVNSKYYHNYYNRCLCVHMQDKFTKLFNSLITEIVIVVFAAFI